MAKLTAPLLSLAASGRIGDGPVYSNWRGTPYARAYAVPTDPKSPAQTSRRAMFHYLAYMWAHMHPAILARWADTLTNPKLSPYTHFMRINLQRWTRFQAPILDPTAVTPHEMIDDMFAVADVVLSTVNLSGLVFSDNTLWGSLVFRTPAPYRAPGPSDLIAVIPVNSYLPFVLPDVPPHPGTYFYHFRFILDAGITATGDTSTSALVD